MAQPTSELDDAHDVVQVLPQLPQAPAHSGPSPSGSHAYRSCSTRARTYLYKASPASQLLAAWVYQAHSLQKQPRSPERAFPVTSLLSAVALPGCAQQTPCTRRSDCRAYHIPYNTSHVTEYMHAAAGPQQQVGCSTPQPGWPCLSTDKECTGEGRARRHMPVVGPGALAVTGHSGITAPKVTTSAEGPRQPPAPQWGCRLCKACSTLRVDCNAEFGGGKEHLKHFQSPQLLDLRHVPPGRGGGHQRLC